MNWDGVPWMVGGNVKHSTNVARLLAYAAFGGREGVITAGSLEVREQVPAGTGVRVMPGACSILNRGQGVAFDAYAARHPTEEPVPISATTSAGERTDLVIARVENPFQDGEPWAEPSPGDVEAGLVSFVKTRIVSGVDKTKSPREILDPLGYSAIPLAFVTLPASTATVQQAHITDLRTLMNERRSEPIMHIASGDSANPRLLSSAGFTAWPTETTVQVKVPTWATHVTMRAIFGGVRFGQSGSNGGSGWAAKGQLRTVLGTGGLAEGPPTTYDVSNEGGADRITLMTAASNMRVPKSVRGTTQSARVQGLKSGGSSELRFDGGTISTLEVIFSEAAESAL